MLCPAAHYDKCVISLREQCKPDMTPVLESIFSHAQVAKKNKLVIMLIVSRARAPPHRTGGREKPTGQCKQLHIAAGWDVAVTALSFPRESGRTPGKLLFCSSVAYVPRVWGLHACARSCRVRRTSPPLRSVALLPLVQRAESSPF